VKSRGAGGAFIAAGGAGRDGTGMAGDVIGHVVCSALRQSFGVSKGGKG
jgi:hypothetical protein